MESKKVRDYVHLVCDEAAQRSAPAQRPSPTSEPRAPWDRWGCEMREGDLLAYGDGFVRVFAPWVLGRVEWTTIGRNALTDSMIGVYALTRSQWEVVARGRPLDRFPPAGWAPERLNGAPILDAPLDKWFREMRPGDLVRHEEGPFRVETGWDWVSQGWWRARATPPNGNGMYLFAGVPMTWEVIARGKPGEPIPESWEPKRDDEGAPILDEVRSAPVPGCPIICPGTASPAPETMIIRPGTATLAPDREAHPSWAPPQVSYAEFQKLVAQTVAEQAPGLRTTTDKLREGYLVRWELGHGVSAEHVVPFKSLMVMGQRLRAAIRTDLICLGRAVLAEKTQMQEQGSNKR